MFVFGEFTIIRTLSDDMVQIVSEAPGSRYFEIELIDGLAGFTDHKHLRRHHDYRAWFRSDYTAAVEPIFCRISWNLR
jgi:hypothetical protein